MMLNLRFSPIFLSLFMLVGQAEADAVSLQMSQLRVAKVTDAEVFDVFELHHSDPQRVKDFGLIVFAYRELDNVHCQSKNVVCRRRVLLHVQSDKIVQELPIPEVELSEPILKLVDGSNDLAPTNSWKLVTPMRHNKELGPLMRIGLRGDNGSEMMIQFVHDSRLESQILRRVTRRSQPERHRAVREIILSPKSQYRLIAQGLMDKRVAFFVNKESLARIKAEDDLNHPKQGISLSGLALVQAAFSTDLNHTPWELFYFDLKIDSAEGHKKSFYFIPYEIQPLFKKQWSYGTKLKFDESHEGGDSFLTLQLEGPFDQVYDLMRADDLTLSRKSPIQPKGAISNEIHPFILSPRFPLQLQGRFVTGSTGNSEKTNYMTPPEALGEIIFKEFNRNLLARLDLPIWHKVAGVIEPDPACVRVLNPEIQR